MEHVLRVDDLEERALRRMLRDRGAAEFCRKFFESKRTGPLESEFPKPFAAGDQRD